MDTALPANGRDTRHVACPECGELFVPRGIAAHRRMRHGVVTPAGPFQVAAPLPSSPARAEEESRLLAAFERIARAVESIDARLAARAPVILGAPIAPAAPVGQIGQPDTAALEASLNAVLAEIERVKAEAREQATRWGGVPQNEEQRALEQTTYVRLGQLRRRQAGILFRLQEGDEQGPGLPDCIG